MPYKMIGKRRVWVEEDLEPQKTIRPAQATAPRMSYDDLIGRNIIGRDALSGLFGSVGAPDWQTAPGGNDESGAPILEDAPNAQAASRLNGYTFDWNDTGVKNTGTLTAFDPKGAQAGQFHQQDQSTGDVLKEFAAIGASLLAGPLGLGTALGGALGLSGTLGSVVGSGLIGGGTAALTGQNVGRGLLMGGLGGAVGGYLGGPTDGNGAFLGEGVPSGVPEWDGAFSSIDGIPAITGNPASAPAIFNAAADSQLASNQLGITGAQSAAAATAPAAVDLGSIGGITSTAAPMPLEALRAGELAGYSTNGALPSSPAVPTGTGGLLGQLPSALQGGAQWMTDNPMLGRLLLGGASSLLSSAGGSSGESAPVNTGPAKKWNSPIQQGLLGNVQQYAPPAIAQNRPAGLLAQGHQNAGAWRFLGG